MKNYLLSFGKLSSIRRAQVLAMRSSAELTRRPSLERSERRVEIAYTERSGAKLIIDI